MMIDRRERFVLLDGLRGVLALAVAITHAGTSLLAHDPAPNQFAVPFFFMLSGFVLEHVYGARLRAGFPVLRYLIERAIRLYPLVVISAAIAVPVLLVRVHAGVAGHPSLAAVIGGALSGTTALPSPCLSIDAWRWPANPPLWSLFYELLASLAFGLAACRARPRTLAALAILGWLGLLLVTWRSGNFAAGLSGQVLVTTFTFSAGIWLRRVRGRLLRVHPVVSAMLGVALFGVLFGPALPDLTLAIILGFLLAPALHAFSQVRVRGRLARLCALSGELSYPIYVLHMPLVLLAALPGLGLRPWPAAVLAVGGTLALSLVTARAIDRPLRAWLGRVLLPSRRVATPAFVAA